MSQIKPLVNILLWDIYGTQRQPKPMFRSRKWKRRKAIQQSYMRRMAACQTESRITLTQLVSLDNRQLIDLIAILKVELRIMLAYLEYMLILRDRIKRYQETLCIFVDAALHIYADDAHPRMRFSLSPPPPNTYLDLKTSNNKEPFSRDHITDDMDTSISQKFSESDNINDDFTEDYNEWLQAMKMVVRLPGGTPPEFRRKLWLSLADKYLKSKNVDWSKEAEKCFCESWREDDEELGIQIVKDLHRTGSNLCTGPAGSINQAKLKRVLLGYARYNPVVGYCQGFNMLGALILQVMDKDEAESIKVMIYLVEGVLPHGYFCGSMGGLQADMGVFRELMQVKLPRLAKHLQKLQGPLENAYEPPLTNVFTMQWFLTMFCTCLPMNCVLRVWDLVLIEGSDVLLRTALVLWSLLEERVIKARSADEFYCNMGSYTSELLNGHLIDSNALIEKIVHLGPIRDIDKLRDRHLYNISPLRSEQSLSIYFDDDLESDEESRLALATVWGLSWVRRGSNSHPVKTTNENKERIALDISLLKKQYDRLRERQKQAHIILTTACSTAKQTPLQPPAIQNQNQSLPVSNLLMGRPAIITNRGRRGPPIGAIPPARKPSLPTILHTKPPEKKLKRGETLHWQDADMKGKRRDSLTWKEIKADRAALKREGTIDGGKPKKLRSKTNRSDSSSYSEESNEDDNISSTDTSLCDDDVDCLRSSFEGSPKRKSHSKTKSKDVTAKAETNDFKIYDESEKRRPKSWAPSNSEIPFMLMTSDSPNQSGDEKSNSRLLKEAKDEMVDSGAECDRLSGYQNSEYKWSSSSGFSTIAGDLASSKLMPIYIDTEQLLNPITSTSQLSPMPDISGFLRNSIISPLPTPKPLYLDSVNSLGSGDVVEDKNGKSNDFDVSDDGVTNQYFERVNSVERPTTLNLLYSFNKENDQIQQQLSIQGKSPVDSIPTDSTEEFKLQDETHDFSKSYPPRDDYIPGENREDEFKEPFLEDTFAPVQPKLERLSKEEQSGPKCLIITKSNSEDFNTLEISCDKEMKQDLAVSDVINLEKKCSSEFSRIPMRTSTNDDNDDRVLKPLQRYDHSIDMPIEKESDIFLYNRSFDSYTERRYYNRSSKGDSLDSFFPKTRKNEEPSRGLLPLRISQSNKYVQNSEENEKSLCLFKEKSSPEKLLSTSKWKIRSFSDESGGKTNSSSKMSASNSPTSFKNVNMNKDNKNEIPDKESSCKGKSSDDENDALKDSVELENDIKDDHKKTSFEKADSQSDTHSSAAKAQKDSSKGFTRNDSFEKNNEIKKKKEPPDENQELQSSADQYESDSKEKKEQEKIDEIQKPSSRTKNESEESANSEEQPEASKTTKSEKKKPPSTEDLEKRFHDLERQFSSTTLNSGLNKDLEDSKTVLETKEQCQKSSTPTPKKSSKDISKSFEEKCKMINETLEKQDEDVKQDIQIKAKSPSVVSEKTSVTVKESQEALNQSRAAVEESSQTLEENSNKNNSESSANAEVTSQIEERENVSSVLVEAKESSQKDADLHCHSKDAKSKLLKSDGEKEDLISSDSLVSSKRRASEPPSTEELEKRYETMKRRMSSRNFTETSTRQHHSNSNVKDRKTIADQLQEAISKETEIKSDRNEEIESEPKISRASSKEPPTTEDLESRFEALLNQNTKENQKPSLKEEVAKETKESSIEKIPSKGDDKSDDSIAMKKDTKIPISEESKAKRMPEASRIEKPKKTEESVKLLPEKVDTKSKVPEAPPMPEVSYNKSTSADQKTINQRRALVEELQSKMKSPPNGENIKPSIINPQKRKLLQKSKTSDETLETHANHAYYRSVNNEPFYYNWLENQQNDFQQFCSSKISVRRFSDLPSRSDLENRLQFLEQKLYKSFTKGKQRRASDSEVTSKIKDRQIADDKPSTSQSSKLSNSEDLENRLKALEKQLSENSLKILTAMQDKTKVTTSLDYDSPKQMSLESIDAAGKELVRYTHTSDVDEIESDKPINISINIKMMLNKDKVQERQKLTVSSANDEIQKRLDMLEQQLKEAKLSNFKTLSDVEKSSVQIETPILPSKPKEETISDDNKEAGKNQELSSPPAQSDSGNSKQEPREDLNQSKTLIKEDSKSEAVESHVVETENAQHNSKQNNFKSEELGKKHVESSEETKKDTSIAKQSIADKSPEEGKESSKEVLETEIEKQSTEIVKPIQELKATSQALEETQINSKEEKLQENISENLTIDKSELGSKHPNENTVVLLMDNEPKAVKVRRLTRANTEELENLFQALEKQISERNLIKSEDGRLIHADSQENSTEPQCTENSQALAELSKEIADFATGCQTEEDSKASKEKQNIQKQKSESKEPEEEYDWGSNTVKHHLKRKTVYLPSTKELEARFRSLERQIHLLEHVEKIDVEQRLVEIERKIKLQYSLSHENDLNKFLELCEGKLDDDDADADAEVELDIEDQINEQNRSSRSPYQSPSRVRSKSPYTSPAREKLSKSKTPPLPKTPTRGRSPKPITPPSSKTPEEKRKSNLTSPARSKSRESHQFPDRNAIDESLIPSTEDLEFRYRSLELKPSRSKENLAEKMKRKRQDTKKQPIHPLELLIDSSPDDSQIPTTGELEHRIRLLDEKKRYTPTSSPIPPRSRSHSPALKESKVDKSKEGSSTKTHLVTYTDKPEPPTAEELDVRMKALEEKHTFDFKTQKTFKEFNQKLKDAISPSLSFEEFKAAKSREASPSREKKPTTPKSPKSALKDIDGDYKRAHERSHYRSTSPKVIRFQDQDDDFEEIDTSVYREEGPSNMEKTVGKSNEVLKLIEENNEMLQRILKQTLAETRSRSSSRSANITASSEGLDAFGSRLMRETSPLRRTGTHTGIPLKTDDNINERLSSIKNTIKSIDSLCEEKPYHKEKCQRYIDSLFSDSVHFSSKEDLRGSQSRISRRDYTPSIRVSDLSERPSSYRGRSIGSADSIRSSSPLRAASPLHHRSTRDIRRDVSPSRHRLDEDIDDYENSRVRRDYMLPNYYHDKHSRLSSYGSLTKFHKVDRQLDTFKYDDRSDSKYEYTRSTSRSPLRSPYGSKEEMMLTHQQHHPYNTTTANNIPKLTTSSKPFYAERPVSPYRQTCHNLTSGFDSYKRSQTPVYAPGKLEIRHTTVTSTFYDRMLTEKQLEKQYSRPPSRSPLISPSVTVKNGLDVTSTNSSAGTSNTLPSNSTNNSTMTSTNVTTHSASNVGTSVISIAITALSNSTPVYTSSTHNASATIGLIPKTAYTSSVITSATTATTTANSYYTGNSINLVPPNSSDAPTSSMDTNSIDSRILKCQNLLSQFTTTRSSFGTSVNSNSTSYASATYTTTSITSSSIANTESILKSPQAISSNETSRTTSVVSAFTTSFTLISSASPVVSYHYGSPSSQTNLTTISSIISTSLPPVSVATFSITNPLTVTLSKPSLVEGANIINAPAGNLNLFSTSFDMKTVTIAPMPGIATNSSNTTLTSSNIPTLTSYGINSIKPLNPKPDEAPPIALASSSNLIQTNVLTTNQSNQVTTTTASTSTSSVSSLISSLTSSLPKAPSFTALSGSTAATTTSSSISSHLPFSYLNPLKSPAKVSTTTTASTGASSSSSYSTGVYNPLMNFTLKQPFSFGSKKN